jgi:hypothetical protein
MLEILEAQRDLVDLAPPCHDLERLGIIDANGDLVSHELPPDMLPDSDTTLETG